MSKIALSGHTDDSPLFGAIKRDINFHLHIHFSSRPKLHPTKFLQRYLFGDQSLDMKPISKITSLLREKFHENFARFASGAVQSFGTKMVWPWSSLVEGDEQTDWHKCRTRMLCICWILFWYCLKHNSLPLHLILIKSSWSDCLSTVALNGNPRQRYFQRKFTLRSFECSKRFN